MLLLHVRHTIHLLSYPIQLLMIYQDQQNSTLMVIALQACCNYSLLTLSPLYPRHGIDTFISLPYQDQYQCTLLTVLTSP